jgi:hypothetical protein
VDRLLTEALENSQEKSEKKLNLFLEHFVFTGVSEQTKLVFLYCCFMDPQFISYELLGELFQQKEEDDLQTSIQYLIRRGLLVETTDKCIRGLELGGEDGCFVTHRCLQEEMRQRLKSEIDRHEILTRIGECLLSNKRLITCDRNVTRKRDGRRIDVNFRQVKHLIAQLSELKLDKNETLLNLFTTLNEKLGYFFLFYEVGYAKALECFQQVNEVMTERSKKGENNFGKILCKGL